MPTINKAVKDLELSPADEQLLNDPNAVITGSWFICYNAAITVTRYKRATVIANSIGNLKEGFLADFFRRINYKRGRVTAINATARKLAVIIWNMLVKGMPYKPPVKYLFLDQKRKMKFLSNIRRNISKFGLKPEDVRFAKQLE